MNRQEILSGTRRQNVTISQIGARAIWRVKHADGTTEDWDTAQAAFNEVCLRAEQGNAGVTLTMIDWLGVPEGFDPPRRMA